MAFPVSGVSESQGLQAGSGMSYRSKRQMDWIRVKLAHYCSLPDRRAAAAAAAPTE